MGAPAAGVGFDRSRLNSGELMAGIAGLVLLIDLWFKWYGVKVSGGGGALQGFSIGVSANAWEVFSLVDLILFLVAVIAIAVAVLRAMDRMPDLPFPPATLVAIAGAVALVLIIFRFFVTPVDTHGVDNIDVTRKLGLYIGLIAAAVLTYGGWRAMEESGATWSDITGGAGRGGGGAGAAAAAPTTPMPAGGDPGVPGGGAAGVSPGKEGPGAPHPGTSTGGPGDGDTTPTPPAAGADPAPGTGPETPPGLAGEPPATEGERPPGL
jgi:hypothetical protein